MSATGLPLLALFLLQMDSGMEAIHQVDPVLLWMQRFSLAAAVIAVVLVAVLILTQRRLSDTWLKVFAVGGLVVFPLFSLAMGNVVGLEQAKKVQFCGSCHLTMGFYIQDMTNPQSDTLAARHYRNRWIPEAQCYTCHASYGLFGDVQAKMQGLNDVYKYYTHTYKFPLHTIVPFKNADCLKCHEGTPKFVNAESHAELLPQIRSGEFRCIDCHGPIHPEQTQHESTLRY